ncbi:hypothetical protein [Flagellimonas eckloniae]|uniref:Uncharacterized protein n=1 Tax=Flagellimonas eckloniae TaxID=346185 RepID=A0A0Q1H5L2_9FLAO|nr:hypothetical protein [Allomuricauda eckloniae]KQC28848.1 hypothetical protein AAY42_02270 [Allomuricauda eckloniae]
MEYLESYFVFGGILKIIGQLLFLIGCIVLVLKKKNKGTVLMLIGAILSILFALASFLLTSIAVGKGTTFLARATVILNSIGQFPLILVGIGLLLFGTSYSNKKR